MPAEPLSFTDGRRARAPKRASHEYVNRDLAWLEFNRRVLHEALDDRTPLLERVKFLAIFNSNLDEFVMKRVYGLREQVRAGVTREGRQQIAPGDLLSSVRRAIQGMLASQAAVWRDGIRPSLARYGIHLIEWADLDEMERRRASVWFEQTVFPMLTPLAMDVGHPFPFISNLSASLGLLLRDPETGERSFARVKVPDALPQWVRLDEGGGRPGEPVRALRLAALVEHHLPMLFPGMDISAVMPFRVTRNADVESDLEDVEDLLEAMQKALRQRRMECAVRLEHLPSPDPELRRVLMEELELDDQDVYEMPGLLEYRSLMAIATLPHPKLRDDPWRPIVPRAVRAEDVRLFDVIRAGDLLVHHPYDSFDDTVLRLVTEAVDDPDVLAIKMTLYRTGTDSPFIPLLIRAAESGKSVACLVELKARFDEEQNIQLARRMEKAGVHVVYGLEGLKTHTKTTLVVRREGREARCYAHVGTGNYHYQTARLYVDLGLLTCRSELTADLAHLFNFLTGRSRKHDYDHLLVAPANMKRRFLELIARETAHQEAGRPARIVAKMNQIEDREICQALIAASTAGVPIDLIVRGFSVLRPGVAGSTERIRIVSVIGRFLEHSRIFYFRNGAQREADGDFYIGSADWMHRNLEARVEAVTPVADPGLRRELWDVIETYLTDHRSAWDMQPDGSYRQRRSDLPGQPSLGAQQALMERARRRGR